MEQPPQSAGRLRGAGAAATVVLALAVPFVALGNALLLLLLPWMADVQYALPGFPADPLGLAGGDRTALAHVGIRSIWPLGAGPELLEEATLPAGSDAFTPREIHHMEDVRALVRVSLGIWLGALLAGALALTALVRGGRRSSAVRALGRGALVTLALMVAILLVAAVAFEPFFDLFHGVFFEGDTWKFKDHYTLRRLYPDAFWSTATVAMATVVLAQALAVGWWSGAFRRFVRRPR